ncbi:unnamed protein product, partial [Ectocarpus sp. 13 AM-2016]
MFACLSHLFWHRCYRPFGVHARRISRGHTRGRSHRNFCLHLLIYSFVAPPFPCTQWLFTPPTAVARSLRQRPKAAPRCDKSFTIHRLTDTKKGGFHQIIMAFSRPTGARVCHSTMT